MKSFIKFFVCGFFFFSLSPVFSQQGYFSTQIIYFPDSSYLGYSDTFAVRVKNTDTASYTGFINVYVSADTSAFSVANLYTNQQATIAGLDSIQFTCNILFDSTYFNGGNNIVVVWSSGNAIAPSDSIWSNVYLKTTGAGVHEIINALSFSLHPSIASSFIQIESAKQETSFEKIRILDVFGREISSIAVSKKEKESRVGVSSLPNGIYFLEVSSGNLRSTKKFVKMD